MPTFRCSDFLSIANMLGPRLQSRIKGHTHVAFVYDRRGAMIAHGINKVGSRSRGAGFSDYTIHAERAALKRVGDIRRLVGATLVVLRVGVSGQLKSSKPCHECQRHLEKCIRVYGLLRVYYS